MPSPRTVRHHHRLIALALAGAVVLAACDMDSGLDPEPTATATIVSFGPDDVPVGTLLDEGSVAWDDVEAWVETSHVDSPSAGTGDQPSSASTDRVILPDRRHASTSNGDTVVTEEILVDGTVYMRGTLVASSIYPDVDADTWIAFTPDQVPPDTALEQRVTFLTDAIAYPFAGVTAETRAMPASPAGTIDVDGRTCEVWTFSGAASGDSSLAYRIAFDGDNRPCQLVREGGGVSETRTWTYPAEPDPIVAPADAVQVDAFPDAPS